MHWLCILLFSDRAGWLLIIWECLPSAPKYLEKECPWRQCFVVWLVEVSLLWPYILCRGFSIPPKGILWCASATLRSRYVGTSIRRYVNTFSALRNSYGRAKQKNKNKERTAWPFNPGVGNLFRGWSRIGWSHDGGTDGKSGRGGWLCRQREREKNKRIDNNFRQQLKIIWLNLRMGDSAN